MEWHCWVFWIEEFLVGVSFQDQGGFGNGLGIGQAGFQSRRAEDGEITGG